MAYSWSVGSHEAAEPTQTASEVFPFESLLIGGFGCFTGDLAGWAGSVVVNALLLSAAIVGFGFNRRDGAVL